MRNTYTVDDNIVYTTLITGRMRWISAGVYHISFTSSPSQLIILCLTLTEHQISSSWGHRGKRSKIDGIVLSISHPRVLGFGGYVWLGTF